MGSGTFFSVKFNGKSARIASRIGRALFSPDGGEAEEDGGALADATKELGLAVL